MSTSIYVLQENIFIQIWHANAEQHIKPDHTRPYPAKIQTNFDYIPHQHAQLRYLSEKYVKCYYNLIEDRNHPKTYASGINNGRTLTLEHPRRTPNTPTQLHRLLANECIAFILRLPLSKVHTQTILAATHQIHASSSCTHIYIHRYIILGS